MAMRHALILLTALSFSVSAQASDINAEGAAKLKALFQSILERQAEKIDKKEGHSVAYEGETKVEIVDTHYAVTLPHISINHPNEHRTEIGMIAINAVPQDDPAMWKMAVALPTPILMYDNEDAIVSRLDLGTQRASGLWHTEKHYFTSFDAQYADITYQKQHKFLDVTVPSMTITHNLEQSDTGTWSGPSEIIIDNINIKTALDQDTRIEKIHLKSHIDGYDHDKMHDDVLGNIGTALSGVRIDYALSNAVLSQPKLGAEGEHTLQFSSAALGFEAKKQGNENASFNFTFNFKDLALPDPKHDTAPQEGKIDIAINNVPLSQMVALGQNTFQGAMADPAMRKMAGLALMLKLPAMLAVAKTNIMIEDSYAAHDSYRLNLDGEAKADLTAANSATATINMRVSGMDWLTENMPEDAEGFFVPVAKMLIKLKDIARIEKDAAKDEEIHIFQFVMSPQGQMLINGHNAMALLITPPKLEPAPVAAKEKAAESLTAGAPPASKLPDSEASEEPSPVESPAEDAQDQ